MKRFLVILLRLPSYDPSLLQPHKDYLERLRAAGQLELAGPFDDMQGGAYLIRAEDRNAALALVHADPAYTSGAWQFTVHAWQAR